MRFEKAIFSRVLNTSGIHILMGILNGAANDVAMGLDLIDLKTAAFEISSFGDAPPGHYSSSSRSLRSTMGHRQSTTGQIPERTLVWRCM